jgi:pimeloyl-ACP methyl ester carboxylesterase
VDTTVTLEIDGTRQRVRLCGSRSGLPPLLVVQGGPGLTLLNEASRYQQCLRLEERFSVAYWDQRGCGPAPRRDAQAVSLKTQISDVSAVVRWLAHETGQPVVLLGISLGATIALEAAARGPGPIHAVVAVSIDTETAAGDAAALAFLREAGSRHGRRGMPHSLRKLGAPPYTTPGSFQRRARLLTDLGGIEHGKRLGAVLRSLFSSLVRTYGWLGAAAALRNMNAIQRTMLPELVPMNLFTDWPRPAIPVHYVFGGNDPLVTEAMVQRLSALTASSDTVVTLRNAGHLAHFDQPDIVRSIILQVHSAS